MLFQSESLPLPVQDDIGIDESGAGYALRMAGSNHLSFTDIAVAVGSDSRTYLPHSAAGKLAYWFGADPVRLGAAIQSSYKLAGQMATGFMGHVFCRTYHVRQHAPQICPACLRMHRKAYAWWDIALVTVCPEHRCRLLDACAACGRRVSWRRPAMLFCQCGAAFDQLPEPDECPSKAEMWLTSHVRNLLCPSEAIRVDVFEQALSFMAALSLDCLLRLVWAFGILPDQDAQISPGEMTRLHRTEEAAAIIARAFCRLQNLVQESAQVSDRSRIQTTALRSMLDESRSMAESTMIANLLQLAAPIDSKRGRQIVQEGRGPQQLDLFGRAP